MSRDVVVTAILVAALGGCATAVQQDSRSAGSWFMKEGAFQDDLISRSLVIGAWHSEATDIHGATRTEDSMRLANGTYVAHFIEKTESGQTKTDHTECGRWGVSGNIYFTITEAIRERGQASPVPPTDASFYDAYVVLRLTKTTFEYKHVVGGETFRETRVEAGDQGTRSLRRGQSALSLCEGTET